jgi:hypothetical protein
LCSAASYRWEKSRKGKNTYRLNLFENTVVDVGAGCGLQPTGLMFSGSGFEGGIMHPPLIFCTAGGNHTWIIPPWSGSTSISMFKFSLVGNPQQNSTCNVFNSSNLNGSPPRVCASKLQRSQIDYNHLGIGCWTGEIIFKKWKNEGRTSFITYLKPVSDLKAWCHSQSNASAQRASAGT